MHTRTLLITLLFSLAASAQSVTLFPAGKRSSLRGLSVTDDHTFWASGSGGWIARSTDGGASIQWIQVPGFEKREFRDIEGFDSLTAVIMAVAEPAQILRTTDGGAHWSVVFTDSAKGMFLDAMDFSDALNGIVVGDPLAGRMFIARTADGGKHWLPAPAPDRPAVAPGEACFASSGTNIHLNRDRSFYLVTGGTASHLFHSVQRYDIPLSRGRASTGANSVAVAGKQVFIAGGDFSKKDLADSSFATGSPQGGFKMTYAMPSGYRSCIIALSARELIACGLNGIDRSPDGGITWQKISGESFHVAAKAKKGTAVYFAGNGGRIAVLNK